MGSGASFGGSRTTFPSTGRATRSRLKPFPDFVGQAAPILVKKDFLLEPSRTTKASNAGLLLLIFSFVHPATIAGFMEELWTGKPAARQDDYSGAERMERAGICAVSPGFLVNSRWKKSGKCVTEMRKKTVRGKPSHERRSGRGRIAVKKMGWR